MNRQAAEEILTAHLQAIYGFALKRCRTPEDAEDVSQEIALRAYQAFTAREDIRDPEKYLWTIAHHVLTNHYRESARSTVGVSLDEVADILPDPDSLDGEDDRAEALRRMRREIAYLSETRRRVVIAYWFENRRQADIAAELGIPVGTVKWHLFEAKRDLRKGMETMRQNSELTYNPIKFARIGLNGSAGTQSISDVLRSPLTQNVAYCVRCKAMTVAEIADALGVSPVYVEGEVKFLEEYGLLSRQGDGYMADFLITEPTADLLICKDKMYKSAAALIADELYDRLCASGILDDPSILCGRNDHNFLLWTLIPFILARSGEHLRDDRITFEEVATIRPDGGHNIIHADVLDKSMTLPDDLIHMRCWCGPMWNQDSDLVHWQIDHEWANHGDEDPVTRRHHEKTARILSLYRREKEAPLSPAEYAWLSEQGYIKTCGDPDGHFESAWQIVQLSDRDIVRRLLAVGDEVKEAHNAELEALKQPFVEASLAAVAPHLRKTRAFELQYVFHSDGWFLLHCIEHLLRVGKLTPPTEEQKRAVTTLIFSE